jgi:cob(I)alamin adenosyltransferase
VTKTGDAGTTSLMYGRRVSKCDPRVEGYGTVDELNAALGCSRAWTTDTWLQERILLVQQDLVVLMGELATHPVDLARFGKDGFHRFGGDRIGKLETWVQELEAIGIRYEGWATPGGTPASAAFDLARTVCRRAERQVCRIHEAGQLDNADIIIFLNRLSDLLWLMARRAETTPAPAPAAAAGT